MKRFFVMMLALALCIPALPGLALEKTSADYDPMYTLTGQYGFKLGASFSYHHLKDQKYLDFVSRHFNSITANNEMKAYSLLNQMMCKVSKDGMPQMNYYQADKMVAWARDNGLKVRGHVLVWDAYMPDWFFRERYENHTPYVDQQTMRARLESYITQVVTHFETEFPGVVYCWDVVNEAVGDNAGEFVPGDPKRLRTIRSEVSNLFRDRVGEDYVEFSFLCARNAAEALNADIGLFYNDYNAFQLQKRVAISELVKSINAYAKDENGEYRKLIDGVGMQGYIGGYGTQNGCMSDGDISRIRDSILAYQALGMDVHITEMAVRNYELDQAEKHAAYYGRLMKMFTSLQQNGENPLSCVAIWGLVDCSYLPKDHYSYKLNSPYGGLINEKYELKPAFDTVYTVLKGE